jgi:hypothetical protein
VAVIHINNKQLIKLVFCGIQTHFKTREQIPLWNLGQPIDGHSENSTVTERTLSTKGFFVPDAKDFQRGDIYDPETVLGI